MVKRNSSHPGMIESDVEGSFFSSLSTTCIIFQVTVTQFVKLNPAFYYSFIGISEYYLIEFYIKTYLHD